VITMEKKEKRFTCQISHKETCIKLARSRHIIGWSRHEKKEPLFIFYSSLEEKDE